MRQMQKKRWLALLLTLVLTLSLQTLAYALEGPVVELTLLATTDLHANMMDYDYYKDAPSDLLGFSRTATLIEQVRQGRQNVLLFDNGDLLQGTPLSDYIAKVAKPEKGNPIYEALNALSYDGATLGNHEFNYGLPFLLSSAESAVFPIVCANVFYADGDGDDTNNKPLFPTYQILDKQVTDSAGQTHTLQIGVTGAVPPKIMQWDKGHLEGQVIALDMVDSVQRVIPEMKAAGADIIVVLAHTGISDAPRVGGEESTGYYMTQLEDVDVVVTGHSHLVFPSATFEKLANVDLEKGTINGVPVVMAGSWGSELGVIDLKLSLEGEAWTVAEGTGSVMSIYSAADKAPIVTENNAAAVAAIEATHNATVAYVRGPVGNTTAPIHSYFALVQDDPSIQIVNQAQTWYVQAALKGTEYEQYPVLSAAAPFKAGGRGGAEYYTDIPTGTIAIKNVADLYLYPNTVHAVLLTGAQVQEWLEWSAQQFNVIDPAAPGEQSLINMDFPTYNFDVIDGVTYQIDVTQPAKYDRAGEVVNPDANRIKNLQFEGKAIDPEQLFVVATNNYRANSSKVANPDGQRIILASPDENRQAIINYILEHPEVNPSADGNWTFVPVPGAQIVFETSPNAQAYLAGFPTMTYLSTLESGFAAYSLVLE